MINVRIFSVGASGGIPPPHDQMIPFVSPASRIMLITPASTSAGVPMASTSLGGRLPSRMTPSPASLPHLRYRVVEAEVKKIYADFPEVTGSDLALPHHCGRIPLLGLNVL